MTVQISGSVPEFTICDRLRKARELTGLDQGPFALELGVSRGTVSNYERDEHAAFKPIVLQAWSLRTGVPLEWLKTGIHADPTDPGRGAGTTTDKLAQLTERKLSRSKRGGAHTHEYLAVA